MNDINIQLFSNLIKRNYSLHSFQEIYCTLKISKKVKRIRKLVLTLRNKETDFLSIMFSFFFETSSSKIRYLT